MAPLLNNCRSHPPTLPYCLFERTIIFLVPVPYAQKSPDGPLPFDFLFEHFFGLFGFHSFTVFCRQLLSAFFFPSKKTSIATRFYNFIYSPRC